MTASLLPRGSGWAPVNREVAEAWGFSGRNWQSQFIAWLRTLPVRVQRIERIGYRTRWAYRRDELNIFLSDLHEQARQTDEARERKTLQYLAQNS